MADPRAHATMIPVLTEVTRDVFETMVFLPVTALAPLGALPGSAATGIVGSVSFTGSTNGAVLIHAPMPTARAIAASMLGLASADDLRDELADAIGELTNMIAGSFRTRMADDSGAWTISTPHVTIGADLSIQHVGVLSRTACPFDCAAGRLFVKLVLTEPKAVTERQEARAC